MYLAVPPAVVILASIVHGVEEQVAPAPEKLCTTGEPFTVPAAHDAVPQVRAPVRIDVALPPVRIGVTVGLPASAQHATVVIVQSTPKSFGHAAGESLSLANAV